MAPLALAAAAPAEQPRPRKLRLGIFADARLQPRWLAEGLARVSRSDFAEIALIAVVPCAPKPKAFLNEAYGRLDRWAFGAGPTEPVELAAESFKAENLVALDLDVALAVGDFDDTVLDGVARLGVWRFALDGEREVAAGEPASCARLLARLAAGAPPRVACESWSRTYPFSPSRNRAELLHRAAEFPARALREAQRSGRAWLEQCRKNRDVPHFPARSAKQRKMGYVPIFPIARRALEKALTVDQWFLAFRLGEGPLGASLAGFTRLVPPKDRDWADPFALEKDGRYTVFFEERMRAAGKGRIAVVQIDAEGRASAPETVLERDYHCSYPFVFEHDGALYMVPETAQNGTVELYRCTDFPRHWKLERVLLQGVRLADATLHRGPDRWWLFAGAAPGESRVFDDELHLFHAPSPFGDWQAHPRNPVRSDARCARPAGRLFWRNGALHRPAQICVPRYGAGLAVHRVLRLTPHEYAERQVERLLPADDGVLGMHTVNRAGHLTVVDGFMRRRRL